jgi:hypothetical protein
LTVKEITFTKVEKQLIWHRNNEKALDKIQRLCYNILIQNSLKIPKLLWKQEHGYYTQ